MDVLPEPAAARWAAPLPPSGWPPHTVRRALAAAGVAPGRERAATGCVPMLLPGAAWRRSSAPELFGVGCCGRVSGRLGPQCGTAEVHHWVFQLPWAWAGGARPARPLPQLSLLVGRGSPIHQVGGLAAEGCHRRARRVDADIRPVRAAGRPADTPCPE